MTTVLTHWTVWAAAIVGLVLLASATSYYTYWGSQKSGPHMHYNLLYTPIAGFALAMVLTTTAVASAVFFSSDNFDQSNSYTAYVTQQEKVAASADMSFWEHSYTAGDEQWVGTGVGDLCWVRHWSRTTGISESGLVYEPCDLERFATSGAILDMTDTTPFLPSPVWRTIIVIALAVLSLVVLVASVIFIQEKGTLGSYFVASMFIAESRRNSWMWQTPEDEPYPVLQTGRSSPFATTSSRRRLPDPTLEHLMEISRKLRFSKADNWAISFYMLLIGVFAAAVAIVITASGVYLVHLLGVAVPAFDPASDVGVLPALVVLVASYAMAVVIAATFAAVSRKFILNSRFRRLARAVDEACALTEPYLPPAATDDAGDAGDDTSVVADDDTGDADNTPFPTPPVSPTYGPLPADQAWKPVLWFAGEGYTGSSSADVSRQVGHPVPIRDNAISQLRILQTRCWDLVQHPERCPQLKEAFLCATALKDTATNVDELFEGVDVMLADYDFPPASSTSSN